MEFLKNGLTDPRVAAEPAPFDHPELPIPDGSVADTRITLDAKGGSLAAPLNIDAPVHAALRHLRRDDDPGRSSERDRKRRTGRYYQSDRRDHNGRREQRRQLPVYARRNRVRRDCLSDRPDQPDRPGGWIAHPVRNRYGRGRPCAAGLQTDHRDLDGQGHAGDPGHEPDRFGTRTKT